MTPWAKRVLTLALATYLLDQTSKALIRRTFDLGQGLPVLPFFSLNRVENTGVAFGLFPGWNAAFIAGTIVVLGALFLVGRHLAASSAPGSLAVGLLWGGGLGNLTDRVVFGHVTDFLDFFIGGWHWPSFNVADSAITVGAGLLAWTTLRRSR